MANRSYNQGVATLGFPGGPSIRLRLNPNQINWSFEIHTSVTETLGGRVVQVTGASLSDLTIVGSFGEDRAHKVTSRQMAEAFVATMKTLVAYQSRDSRVPGQTLQPPAVFSYPPKNWSFDVYIKSLSDPAGGMSIAHTVGRFAYDYSLVLNIANDRTNTSGILGSGNGALAEVRDAAIESYVARIADGVGWKFTDYNGHPLSTQITYTAPTPQQTQQGVANKYAAQDRATGVG